MQAQANTPAPATSRRARASKPVAPSTSQEAPAPTPAQKAAENLTVAEVAAHYGLPVGAVANALRIAATVHRAQSVIGRLPLEMRDSKLYKDGKRVTFDRDAVSMENLISYDRHRPLVEAWRTLEAGPKDADKVRAAIERGRKANL